MVGVKKLLSLILAASLGLLLMGPPAGADPSSDRAEARPHALFVQTNDPTGNEVVVYERASDGTLTQGESFPTGGLGGIAEGAVSDPLASQGSLTYDRRHSLLFAVNAGSDSFTVFDVDGRSLDFVQELSSGGRFPVSVAVHGRLVYVLNGGGPGKIEGYRIRDGRLHALEDSSRSLGLNNTTPPNFLMSPAQVGFTPDGNNLVVTTKGNGTIEVFGVREDHRPTERSVSTPDAGVPFAFVFGGAGRLFLTEAATGAATSYELNPDRTLSVFDGPVLNGQKATCWIVAANGYLYASNTASNTISGYAKDEGALSLTVASGVAAMTGAGPIDMAVSPNGSILYLQNGVDQTISSFAVMDDGTLKALSTTPGPPATQDVPFEGIVAT